MNNYEPTYHRVSSADDIRRMMRSRSGIRPTPLHNLLAEKRAETEGSNRKTVIKMLDVAIKKRVEWLKENYPLRDGERFIYVRYPAQNPEGDWEAVNVQFKGYDWLLSAMPFVTFERCLSACQADNKLHGIDEEFAKEIITISMGLHE